jgi:Domain of unknown function (DUF222)
MLSITARVSDTMAMIDRGLDALDAVSGGEWAAMPVGDRLAAMEELEVLRRRAAAVSHTITATLAYEEVAVLGDRPFKVIADTVRISLAESRRRLRHADLLRDRQALSGEPLQPRLPATAAVWRAGLLDGDHLRVIVRFFDELPVEIGPDLRACAEHFLAEKACELRPDQLAKVAERLAITLNPDGTFSDEDRARRRGFTWSPQRQDGMSRGVLWASPGMRADLDAYLARFAAPGMCNPYDQTACTEGEPDPEVAAKDTRTVAQRQHDALQALVRSQLGNPALGQHNGLPVSVVVSTTLQDLCRASGVAVTATGTLLPIREVIRMAAHAWHYLCVFDEHTERPLYLGRTKRLASADQRIVLYAKDRGCTAPGCDKPGAWCEVHHVNAWVADNGQTNVDELTLACGGDHKLVGPGGWTTRKRKDGKTEWIPPPGLPLKGGINEFHHPERYLGDRDETDGDDR